MSEKRDSVVCTAADGELGGFLEDLRERGLHPTRLVIVDLDVRPVSGPAAPAQDTAPAVMEAWHQLFADRAYTAAEVLRLSWELNTEEAKRLDLALRCICKERGAPLTPRVLGHWLRSHENVRIAGRYFARSGERDHTNLWRLRTAKP